MKRVLMFAVAVAAGILIGFALSSNKGRQKERGTISVSPLAGEKRTSPDRPRVALVIDDWGYNLKNPDLLAEIGRPLTLAVLPHCPFSEDIAREGKELDCEIILHLPLASTNEAVIPEPSTISAGMSQSEVGNLVEEALAGVPGAVGVSNHMGSAATENPELMRWILAVIKRESGLFFLDSMTTPHSVCGEICRELNLPFLSRDVFLDVEFDSEEADDAEQIAGRLRELAGIARRRGQAVGIGHDRTLTLTVIRDTIPVLEAEGVRFVHLSELLTAN